MAASALDSDQILFAILAHADATTLARAAQVNQRWAAAATDFLWRDASANDFSAITPGRRHIYAAKVRVLRGVSGGDDACFLPGGVLAALAFPRAEAVVAYRAASVAAVEALDARCPSLRSLGRYLLPPAFMVDDGDFDVGAGSAMYDSADDGN